jgi:hypothetical protein
VKICDGAIALVAKVLIPLAAKGQSILGGESHFRALKAVSQLLWPFKDREVCFSLGENHDKAFRFD